jgi:hypothetical protein
MAEALELQGFTLDPLSLQDFKLDPAAAGSDYCYSPWEQLVKGEASQHPPSHPDAAEWQQQDSSVPVKERPMDDWGKVLRRPSVISQMRWYVTTATPAQDLSLPIIYLLYVMCGHVGGIWKG